MSWSSLFSDFQFAFELDIVRFKSKLKIGS